MVATAISIRNERSAETAARDRLIDQLVNSGQAAAQQRLALPGRPRRIAILAGAGTAGAADLDTLSRRLGARVATAAPSPCRWPAPERPRRSPAASPPLPIAAPM